MPKAGSRGEVIGGGWIVIARTKEGGRLRPSAWPVEHESREVAEAERLRLIERQPDTEFTIWKMVEPLAWEHLK